MKDASSPDVVWLRQWRAAGPALEQVRRRELRELSDEQALAASEELLELASSVPPSRERLVSCGLVIQQALFHRRSR